MNKIGIKFLLRSIIKLLKCKNSTIMVLPLLQHSMSLLSHAVIMHLTKLLFSNCCKILLLQHTAATLLSFIWHKTHLYGFLCSFLYTLGNKINTICHQSGNASLHYELVIQLIWTILMVKYKYGRQFLESSYSPENLCPDLRVKRPLD